MNCLRSFVVAVTFVLSCMLPTFASAQEAIVIGTLSKTHDSIAKVMRVAGCNSNWLSQVLADSGINPAKLRRLKIGQKIYLRGGSCKETPPVQVARFSGMVLRLESNASQTANLQAEIASLRDSGATTTRRLESVSVENNQLKLQVTNLEKQLADANQAAQEAKAREAEERGKRGFGASALTGTGFLTLFVGLVLAHSAHVQLDKALVSFPWERQVRFGKKTYLFSFVGTQKDGDAIIGLYKCHLQCTGQVRDDEFDLHMSRKHADLLGMSPSVVNAPTSGGINPAGTRPGIPIPTMPAATAVQKKIT